MYRLRRIGMRAGLIGAATALALGAVLAQQARGDAENGKQLFYAHGCYGCHGFNGETGARDLVGTGSPIIADEATFVLFLRLRGDQAPELPSTRMPNFPVEALSDAEARDLYAYVRTFKLDAPSVDDVPTLRAILDAATAAEPPRK
jgi:mono/diheme cytochrome c family protein